VAIAGDRFLAGGQLLRGVEAVPLEVDSSSQTKEAALHFHPLPFDSPLIEYENQAQALLDAHRSADAGAISLIHTRHPRFLDSKIPWLPKDLPDSEIRDSPFDLDDACSL
jgi:hypothetical protein